MDGRSELEEQWRVALDAATSAIGAAVEAHTLSPDDCRRELALIRDEREWADRVQWPAMPATSAST